MPDQACPSCGRPGVVELEMKVKSGQLLTMLSCSGCETRSWFADGAPLPLKDVLKITAGDPSFEVKPSVKAEKRRAAAER